MIAVNQHPQVEAVAHGECDGWELTLYVGAAFDFSIPFRTILQEVVARLSTSATCALHLPTYQDREDFVEGKLDWGSDGFDVYYEYSLGYLSLSSCDKIAPDRLWSCLSSIVALDP